MELQGGVRGAAWRPDEAFHITLRFIGDIDERLAASVDEALEGVRAPAFDLSLASTGAFGGARPRALWAGVTASEPLSRLQSKVERAAQSAGAPAERRKFTPHVTLAYLKGADLLEVSNFLAAHGDFSTQAFGVESFHLYSSHLGADRSLYQIERTYPLSSIR